MRISILLSGLGIIGFGLSLWYILRFPFWLTGSIGLFNIVLGVATPRSRKVDLHPESSGAVKLVIDKVGLRQGGLMLNNYELVFLNDRLVLKKLFPRTPFAVVALLFAALGGLIGGLTGLSLEEFLDQRKRDRIRDKNEFTTVSPGDMEIPYQSMSQVRLTGLSLELSVGGRLLVFNMGAEYPPMMALRVREVIPSQYWVSHR